MHTKWVFGIAALCFVVSLTWSKVGRSQTKEWAENNAAMDMATILSTLDLGQVSAMDKARIMNAVDIVEIKNLQSAFVQAEDSGRLDEWADMNIENGGRGIYYEDPVTGHLVVTGHPVDLQGNPLKGYPGCIMFGKANVESYLAGLGSDYHVRPHADGWQPGRIAGRHIDYNRWVVTVTGDTAELRDYYEDTGNPETLGNFYAGTDVSSTSRWLSESDLVRTPKGWKFAFKKIVYGKPTPERKCAIADPKFPIPPAGSFGVKPDFLHPN
jgi:hypothetical protein